MLLNTKNGTIDTDKVEYVKPIYGLQGARELRVYFEDCIREYDDPDGGLYEAIKASPHQPVGT